MPNEPPICRIILFKAAPCGISDGLSSETARAVKGTISSAAPSPRHTKGIKKYALPVSRFDPDIIKPNVADSPKPRIIRYCGRIPLCSIFPKNGDIIAAISVPGNNMVPV